MASVRICVSVLEILAVVFLIHLANGEEPEIFVKFPANIKPIEGEAAIVTCIAKGPNLVLEYWRRNKDLVFEKITDTDRVYTTLKTEGNIVTAILHFKKVEQSDESIKSKRRYSCKVYNTNGALVTAHDFHVNFIPRSDLPTALPNTTKKLEKKLGDSLQLMCNITYPKSSSPTKMTAMYWIKDGVVIRQVDAVEGKFKKKLDVLTFDEISLGDAGDYECIIRTTLLGDRDYNVTGGPFLVHIIPEIDENKRKGTTIKTTQGNSATFKCAAVGYPLNLIWKVKPKYASDWKSIAINDSRLSINEKESKLEIKDVQYTDRGSYNCCVESSPQKDENLCQEFILRVRVIPEIDENKRKGTTIKTTQGNSATFKCAAVGYPLNLIIVFIHHLTLVY